MPSSAGAPRAVAKSSGDLAGSAVSKINPLDALSALNQLVAATREAIEIHEVESTKREKLKTYRETEIERIQASERVLRLYFDRVFQEADGSPRAPLLRSRPGTSVRR